MPSSRPNTTAAGGKQSQGCREAVGQVACTPSNGLSLFGGRGGTGLSVFLDWHDTRVALRQKERQALPGGLLRLWTPRSKSGDEARGPGLGELPDGATVCLVTERLWEDRSAAHTGTAATQLKEAQDCRLSGVNGQSLGARYLEAAAAAAVEPLRRV